MAACSVCYNIVIDTTDIDGDDPLQKIVSDYAWQVQGNMIQRGTDLEVCPRCLDAALNFSPEHRDRGESRIDNHWAGKGSIPMQSRAVLPKPPRGR